MHNSNIGVNMPALQIREMPDELYMRLKNSAKINHRSLAQETISMLEQALQPVHNDVYNTAAEEKSIDSRFLLKEKIFRELDELNAKEDKISANKIKQLCLENKEEFSDRFDVNMLDLKDKEQ